MTSFDKYLHYLLFNTLYYINKILKYIFRGWGDSSAFRACYIGGSGVCAHIKATHAHTCYNPRATRTEMGGGGSQS